jgi:hypothetical protein
MKSLLVIIFLVLTQHYAFSNEELKSAVKLQQDTEESIKLVGRPLHINCNESNTAAIDTRIYKIQHEHFKDGADQNILTSAISMEYANHLFQELESSNEIQFKFPEAACEARAHKMVQILEKKGIIAAKVFIQGEKNDEKALQYRTNLNQRGHVNWQFHVAPILKVKTGKKKRIKIKDGWFSSKEIEVDEYIDMVFDPSTASKPIPLKQWRSNLLQHRNDKTIETFYTKRFNYRPNERYNTPVNYEENDNDRMMSGLDLGIQCFKNRVKKVEDRRCMFNLNK